MQYGMKYTVKYTVKNIFFLKLTDYAIHFKEYFFYLRIMQYVMKYFNFDKKNFMFYFLI